MNELRRDILLQRWVAVLSESKPSTEYRIPQNEIKTIKSCMFCSGREIETPPEIKSIRKPGTQPNTPGWWVRAIPSLNPILQVEGNLDRKAVGLYDRMNSIGANEILIESPKHKVRPEDMGHDQMVKVVTLYRDRMADLNKDMRLRYIHIFKNSRIHSEETFYHPVSFLVATPVIPKKIKDELENAKQHYDYKDRCIFCDMVREELRVGERIILETKSFISFCPYASSFPFECWIIPKRHSCDFHDISNEEIEDLGFVLMSILKKLKGTFGSDLPISYTLHTAPNRAPRRNHWHTLGDDFHWHIEVIPGIMKNSGFEFVSGFFILTTLPEKAAKYLREVG